MIDYATFSALGTVYRVLGVFMKAQPSTFRSQELFRSETFGSETCLDSGYEPYMVISAVSFYCQQCRPIVVGILCIPLRQPLHIHIYLQ